MNITILHTPNFYIDLLLTVLLTVKFIYIYLKSKVSDFWGVSLLIPLP